MPQSDLIRLAYGSGRLTASRRTIAAAVDGFPGAFTVDDLAARVRERDRTAGATATVYRAVSAMAAAGHLTRVGTRDGHALYARCTGPASHHHHIVCDGCGRVAAARCPLDGEGVAAAQADGFTITRHEVTLYGLCPQCAGREAG